jgi:N-acetyl-alpha-D-muramate 1-phosphate uridylyltransferase
MMPPVAILAGGLGTRLGELTKSIPKALIEVNGEPFIAHQLRLLRQNGVDHVVLCVSHLGEAIRGFVGDGRAFDLRVEYSYDGPVLLGTAGAIRQAQPLLGEQFFILYGDSYLPCDYRAVANLFQASGKSGLMTVFHNEGRWDSSNVEYFDGRILAYDKKNRTPRMEFIDYGLGMLRAEALARVPDGRPFDLAQLYQDLLHDDQLAAFEVKMRFYEIGSLEGIQDLSNYLAVSK